MVDIGKYLIVRAAEEAFATGKFIRAVLRARCEQLVRIEGLQEEAHYRGGPEAEADGVAHVGGDGLAAVALVNVAQFFANFPERCFP